MGEIKKVSTAYMQEIFPKLKIGDKVEITGVIYTGRDAAHKRFVQALDEGKSLPIDLKGQIIYYVGPCPAKPGKVIGPCGPTTSGRMDLYTPRLLDMGMKGMIGKGARSQEVIDSIKKNKSVYFAAIGGTAAIIADSVKRAEVVAYPDLGPEAIYRLEVKDFPCIVAIDSEGNDLYKVGVERYKEKV